MGFFVHKNNNDVNVLTWKSSVATLGNVTTTYPIPEINWVAKVVDTQKSYKWNGVIWEEITSNPLDIIVVSGVAPSSGNLWIDTSS